MAVCACRLPLLMMAATAVASLLIAASIVGDRPVVGDPSVRVVRSSLVPDRRAVTLKSASLYARNDRWKPYLADESVCPGGERTDLPVARQAATMVCLVNFARKRRGLRGLTVAAPLNGVSITKARQIVRCGNFSHNPCGGEWTSVVRAAGYGGDVGENLYAGGEKWGAPRVAVDAWLNSDEKWGAPRVAVDAWLNSESHRENLFDRRWSEQGLALLPGESFGAFRDVVVWVSVFGGGSGVPAG